MATLKLVRVQLQGNWANNTQADVRLGDLHIGSPITVPQCNIWVNYPPSASLNFTVGNSLFQYLNGTWIGGCTTTISPSVPKTNAGIVIPSGFGLAHVTYNVIV